MDPYIGEVIERFNKIFLTKQDNSQNSLKTQQWAKGLMAGLVVRYYKVFLRQRLQEMRDLGARLRSQGYNDAEDRLGQAATGIASLGQVQQGADQSGIGFQFDLGAREQAQKQAELDTLRQTQTQQMLEPYQRIGFLSDIYQGAPSSAMTFTEGTAPNEPSPMQELFGYGIAGLSAASGAQQLGLFG